MPLSLIPSPGFHDKNDSRVWKHHKSLYGLKPASAQWFPNFLMHWSLSTMFNLKLTTLFSRLQESSFVALLVYLDDIGIVSDDEVLVSTLKIWSTIKFKTLGI